ncbi:DUF5689 domain-containing protein [Pedobacter nutrimenti]|uniref:DUF5689 domain-containing protein n=1 Tax=Pedobacter nutrimenti TaxID=1241337 RepID=A0A318UE04_9SPHI|nr:DUF5689 domain-containing protein [Pedobacter nutrimenti]PYF74451.1 hypothetical protein B0O44_104623 [Pedobacter nutrimenti]
MKVKFLYLLLCWTIVLIAGCKKHDYAEGTLSPLTFMENVRNLYNGSDVALNKENLTGATQLTGVVISNPDGGNAPEGLLIMQSTRRQKTRGISLALSTASSYKAGDSIVVTIEGGVLKKLNGALQISGLSDASIRKISSGNKVNVQSASSYSINLKPGDYESTLVMVKSGTINPLPLPTTTFEGNRTIVNGADSIIMHTEAKASFAKEALPATANFAGIVLATQNSSGATMMQIWPRSTEDITERIAPPDPNGPGLGKFPVLISGFVADAKGADGNYEYVQLLATKDINFEKSPMSLIMCTNGGGATPNPGAAPGAGWATGGGRTYKFNLSTGSVKKGEFFYVGGSNKRINGANSTNISDSKWIRAIAYVTNDGDGFGSASGGLLPNSGNAGGIALFEGTNVTEASVPSDVVFFGGTGKTTMFDATTNKGYRIMDNDHYNMKDATSATDQPFIFQGTNTYIIPHPTVADAGYFIKLGGKFNATKKTWETPRAWVFYLMTQSSVVTEIESADVTTLSN